MERGNSYVQSSDCLLYQTAAIARLVRYGYYREIYRAHHGPDIIASGITHILRICSWTRLRAKKGIPLVADAIR